MRYFACVLVAVSMLGCNTVGPRTIQGARFNYNEAIARSWDQQFLLNVVRLYYRDTPQFLEVGDITTKHSISYNAGISGSLGDTDVRGLSGPIIGGITSGDSFSRGDTDTQGLSSSLGFSYSEQPVISYTPLQGEKFVKQMLAPISWEAVLLLTQSGWSLDRVFRLCVQEVNGVFNAPSASGPTPTYVPDYKAFHAFTRALRELQVLRAVELVATGSEETEAVKGVKLRFREALLRTLGDDSSVQDNLETIMSVLNVVSDGESGATGQLGDAGARSTTRSLLGVLHFLSQSVEAPQSHRDGGLVTVTRYEDGETVFDWSDVFSDLMRIRSSASSPEGAFVQIRYRGHWFYIEDSDLASKSTFGLVSNLLALQSGEVKDVRTIRTISM